MKRNYKGIRRFRDRLKEDLKDPKFRKEYERQGPLIETAIKIAKLRERYHMTQLELARKLHTSQQQISRIECGEENITLDTITRIAEVFHKKPELKFV